MSDLFVLVAEVCEEAAKFAETHESCQGRLFETADREVCPTGPGFDPSKIERCCADGAMHVGLVNKLGYGVYSENRELPADKTTELLTINDWVWEAAKLELPNGLNYVAWNDTRRPTGPEIATLFRRIAVRALEKAAVAA